MKKKFRFAIFYLLLPFTITLPILLLSNYAPHTPYNDYWFHFFIPFLNMDSLGELHSVILYKSNEHYIVFPQVLYLLNIYLTNGSNVGLYFINYFLCIPTVFFLYNSFKYIFIKEIYRIILLAIITFFVFAPISAHNWVLSMSGVSWFSANLFFAFSLYLFVKLVNTFEYRILILLIIVSLLGFFSYSTGLMIAPVIMLLMLLVGGKKLLSKSLTWGEMLCIGIYTVYTILITSIWFFVLYEKPGHHPDVETSLVSIVTFTLTFFGSIFSGSTEGALLAGVIGCILVTAVFASHATLFLSNKKISAWAFLPLSLILYGGLNALAAAVSRAGFGISMSMSVRYANIALLFWLGVIIVLVHFLVTHLDTNQYFDVLSKQYSALKRRRRVFLGLQNSLIVGTIIILVLIMAYPLYFKGMKRFIDYERRYSGEELINVSLDIGINDSQLNALLFAKSDTEHITQNKGYDRYIPFCRQGFEPLLLQYTLSNADLNLGSEKSTAKVTSEPKKVNEESYLTELQLDAIETDNFLLYKYSHRKEQTHLVGGFISNSTLYKKNFVDFPATQKDDSYTGYVIHDFGEIQSFDGLIVYLKDGEIQVRNVTLESP